MAALVAAVKEATASQPATFPDVRLAVLELLAAVKEGLYVRLLKRLHFAYKKEGLPHDTASTAAAAHRCKAAPHSCATADLH